MKKQVIFILASLIIIATLISINAQADDDITITPTQTEPTQQNEPTLQEPTTEQPELTTQSQSDSQDTKQIIQEAGSAAKDAIQQGSTQSNQPTETITLPAFLDRPTRSLFKVPTTNAITVSTFTILIALAIALFIILLSIIQELIESTLIKYLTTLILTLIAAAIGTIYRFTQVILSISDITVINTTTIIVITILILILTIILLKYLISLIAETKIQANEEHAEQDGRFLKSFIEVAKQRAKNARKK